MRKYFVTVLAILWSASFQRGLAQNIQEIFANTLYGEYNFELARSPVPGEDDRRILLLRTEKQVNVFVKFDEGSLLPAFTYPAPPETRIVSASFKADDGTRVMILLSNGNIIFLVYDPDAIPFAKAWHTEKPIPVSLFANAQKIVGDAVYVLKQGKIYVSRDTAKTWAIDSAKIGGEYVQDVAVDTSFYAWVITQGKKLYYQHPDSSVWRQAISYTTTGFPYAIFVDRKGRMFVSSSGAEVQMSTNRGVTWTDVSTGIAEAIVSFGDDAFGHIYAVGQGSRAYRLTNLTPPWISIADSINAQAFLPSSAKIVNSIGGDTTLFAATRYGMFQSKDFGTNWVHSPDLGQSRAHVFYAPVVQGGNYNYVSNNLGVYRAAVGDTVWQKVFPKQGYIWGVNVLSSDSAGNVYGNLPLKTGPTSYVFYTVKSTDQGNTWIPDTAGYGALGITTGSQSYDFWVDKPGTEYLGGNGRFLSKKPGQSWKLDTTGLSMKTNEFVKAVTLNNKKGVIYLSRVVNIPGGISLIIYKRDVGGSAWQVVNTSTLAATDGKIMSDQNGNMIIATLTSPYKIWRYDGSVWTEIPLPTAIGTTPFAQLLTVDRDGVLWASFFAGGSNKGVYFSDNNGTTWKYVGLNNVGINFLSAVEAGTTSSLEKSAASTAGVYAVTFIDGIYGFTTSTIPTSVGDEKPQMATSYQLYQNYPNPFNPATNLRFAIADLRFVQLKVYDILGREVAVLVNEQKGPGTYTVEWNAAGFSSGMYFYRLEAGTFVDVKKMLLLK